MKLYSWKIQRVIQGKNFCNSSSKHNLKLHINNPFFKKLVRFHIF
jgi:hypothetical protein